MPGYLPRVRFENGEPAARTVPTELRPVAPGTPEYRSWIDLAADAYPITKLTSAAQRQAAFDEQRDLAQRQPEHRLIGAFRDGRLVGGMRLYDFRMTVRGVPVFSAGIGSVAVALEARRTGVARELVSGYLASSRERGAALGVLYAFRPDFYRKLGFGYGAKLNQYRIALGALPAGGPRECVRRLGPADVDAFLESYARVQQRTNGLIARERWRAALRLGDGAIQTFGFWEGEGRLGGYISFEVRLGHAELTNRNELYVLELIYEHPSALLGLLAFVREMRDQFTVLIVNTTDADFHFVVDDPRNGSDRNLYAPVYHETNAQGIGAMYRVIALPALIEALADARFGELDAFVRIDIDDPFFPANAGAYALRFSAGRPELADCTGVADVDLAIGVADLSALLMGSVRLRSLVAYGRAALSKPDWLRRLDAAFEADPPQCLTRF
jgi:predicted acetyltransferase